MSKNKMIEIKDWDYEMEADHEIIVGDCRRTLKTLPPDCIDCVITSPPYYGLRDYGVDGQIGQENTLQKYIDNLVEVFAEVHRVLKPTGTAWLNIGDCYARSVKEGSNTKLSKRGDFALNGCKQGTNAGSLIAGGARCPEGLKPKDLMLVPARVAIALQEAGWWVRSEIIWGKPNAMPESAKDRPTNGYEHIWFLTKQGKGYYYDYQNAAMPVANTSSVKTKRIEAYRLARELTEDDLRKIRSNQSDETQKYGYKNWLDQSHLQNMLTQIPGFIGLIRKSKYSDIYQDPAIQECLENFKPEAGTRRLRSYEAAPEVWKIANGYFPGAHFATFPVELVRRCLIAGCPEGGVVLDPFGGAGTTALVASLTGRFSISCELNDEYADIAVDRIRQGYN